jgi:hypothetical protein
VPAGAKALDVADQRDERRRGDQADARHRLQQDDVWHLTCEGLELPFDAVSVRFERADLFAHVPKRGLEQHRHRGGGVLE